MRFPYSLFLGLGLSSAVFAVGSETLFDGKTLDGWEGDTAHTWRVEQGAITAGTLEVQVPHNEFLATTKPFGNFELRLKFRLEGTEGFVNAGVQFRSRRIPNHFEMIGYQADLGEGFYGSLYDESRRNKVLVAADKTALSSVLKVGDWNDYRIRCESGHIQLWINGLKTVDYTETDPTVDASGKIALQIHGGGKTRVSYKDIVLDPL